MSGCPCYLVPWMDRTNTCKCTFIGSGSVKNSFRGGVAVAKLWNTSNYLISLKRGLKQTT